MRKPGPMVTGLQELAASFPMGTDMVEVGSWSGESALIFLQSPRVRSLVMVDPFDPALCGSILNHVHHRGTTCEDALALLTQDVLERYANATLLRMTSLEAAAQFADEGRLFDVVYIDACHKEWAVRHDIHAWRPLVKPGGLIAGHDHRSKQYPGVTRAVLDLLGPPDFVYSDTSWVKRV